jgi:hypothetical protein
MLVAEMLKNYKRIVLINNDDISDIHRDYLDRMIKFLNEVLGRELVLEEIKGSSKFLEKMIMGITDGENFLHYKKGQKILQENFFK